MASMTLHPEREAPRDKNGGKPVPWFKEKMVQPKGRTYPKYLSILFETITP